MEALLKDVRFAIQAKHLAPKTEEAYVSWVRSYSEFHDARPADMGTREVNAFLTHLAVDRRVGSSTQNQAASALVFLYRTVLGLDREPEPTSKIVSELPSVLPP